MSTFRLRDVAIPAFAPSIVNAVGHSAIVPVLALLARELGASVGQAAFIVALLGLGSLVGSLPAGALVARVGERRGLALAGILEAAAMVAAALAPTLLVLGAATMASGMAWTVFLLARQGFLIAVAPPAMLARAMSTLGGSHRVGGFVGPLAGAALLSSTGALQSVFWLAAVMALLATVIVLTAPELPGEQVERAATLHTTSGRTQAPGVFAILRLHHRVLLSVGSAVVVIAGSRSLRATVLPLWADHVGISASATSLVFGAAALVEIALFYPAGWLMDRHGRTVVAVPVVAVIGVGVVAMPLAGGIVVFTALALLMAVGNGLGSGIVMTLGADTAPVAGRSQYLGGFRLAGDIGASAGPLLVTVLALFAPLPVACLVTGAGCVGGSLWVWHRVARIDGARKDRAARPGRA